MNSYIDAQCKNILAMIKVFEQACDMAATKDDGKVSKEEAKELSKIHAAAKKFKSEIERINR